MTAWTLKKKHVLVPIDFSTASRRALQVAKDFVEDDSGITALHVVYPPVPPVPSLVVPEPDPNRMLENSRNALQTMLEAEGLGGVKAIVQLGNPASVIVDHAADHRVDMVVMPTHGRKGVSRWLLGSVAERVIRGCHCPVLLLRTSPEDEDEQG